MQRLKNLSMLSLLLLIMIAGILTFSNTTQAANFKPYEYTFVEDETPSKTFNGIRGVKQLNISFDHPVPVADVSLSDVSVVAITEVKGESPTAVSMPIVEKPVISGNTVSVRFKNLDYIDYTDITKSYKLIIKSSAGLYVGQAEDLELPFVIYDILPGFKSVFLDLPASDIESKVFINNAPRDIFVHIPKYYLNNIETIHRYKGVVSTQEAATLTNIDVLTDPAVTRLKVDLNDQLLRDLQPHPSVQGFTLGYASDQSLDVDGIGEFTLKAYDSYGRSLDSSIFRINQANGAKLDNTRIKVSNYITKKANDFGKTYTLYDLMSKPKIFENILVNLSVGDLNKLGVTYANQLRTVAVNNTEQFQLAIQNPKITTINLTDDIDVTAFVNGFMIDRDVTINGSKDAETNYQIIGDVTLGDGSKDLRINLNNVDITGTLTIDTGEGNVIATNVTVDGTDVDTSASVIIKSGGINSIHLINFEATNGIFFANTKPVRVVVANSDEMNNSTVTLGSDQEVILEGAYGTVTSNSDNANLTVRLGTTIEKLVINGAKLTLTRPDSFELPPGVDTSKLEEKSSGETEPGSGDENNNVISFKFKDQLSNNAIDWDTLGATVSAEDLTAENIQIITTGEVKNSTDFGGTITVEITGSTLKIKGLQNPEEEIVKDLILTAEIDGTKYELKIPIKITQL